MNESVQEHHNKEKKCTRDVMNKKLVGKTGCSGGVSCLLVATNAVAASKGVSAKWMHLQRRDTKASLFTIRHRQSVDL